MFGAFHVSGRVFFSVNETSLHVAPAAHDSLTVDV